MLDEYKIPFAALYDPKDVIIQQQEAFHVCGQDHEGRQVMWIKGRDEGTPVEQETAAVHAGIMLEGVFFFVGSKKGGKNMRQANASRD